MKHLMAVAILAALLLSPGARAADLTTEEIVDKAMHANYYRGADGRARVAMTIIDAQERTREREFIILRRDDLPAGQEDPDDTFLGDQKFFVYFLRPSDVRKMVFMVWKHTDKDDDRWLYLPSLDLVKRIASSEKRTSFVGSHFFYEDVSGRYKTEDDHELIETTDNFYVLKHTPKNPASVEFDHYITWVHKGTFLVTQTKFHDKEGNVYRTYDALKVETIEGKPTVMKARMSDSRLGGHTILDYSDVKYDVGLPDDIFTERYLRRPPVQHLR